jgi:hypothetical protein
VFTKVLLPVEKSHDPEHGFFIKNSTRAKNHEPEVLVEEKVGWKARFHVRRKV